MDATKKRVTIVTQSMFFILIIAGILLFSQISNAANNNGPNNKNVTVNRRGSKIARNKLKKHSTRSSAAFHTRDEKW